MLDFRCILILINHVEYIHVDKKSIRWNNILWEMEFTACLFPGSIDLGFFFINGEAIRSLFGI